jgi:hypothetical protein
MIRYFISFPVEARVNAEMVEYIATKLHAAADDRQWRDFVVTHGGTITDMRCQARPVSALVRRARSRVR